jgi:hypothetical protein
MAGNAQIRMRQLVSIADARTKRAAEAVALAHRAADAARIVCERAQNELTQAKAESVTAKREVAAQPASDQIRLWGVHTDRRVKERQDDVAMAHAALAQAEKATAQAIKAWQRFQLRQEHIEKHTDKLVRELMRSQERKIEDESQGSGKTTAIWAAAL